MGHRGQNPKVVYNVDPAISQATSDPEGGKPCQGLGLVSVILMVFAIMIIVSFWRQIAVFLFYLAVTVFCFGVYYIVSIISYIINP